MRALLCALVLCGTGAALAGDLSPEKAAKADRDRKKALEEVDKKYGNRKPSEMSNDERRQYIADQKQASADALDKNGVSAKEFSKFEATASKEDRAAARDSAAAMDKKEADDKKAAEAKAKQPSTSVENGIIIERDTDKKAGKDGVAPK